MYNLDSNRNYWKGSEAGNRRTMYKAAGFGDYDIKEKPHIGVANTFLKDLPEQVISGNLQITLRTESGQQVACP